MIDDTVAAAAEPGLFLSNPVPGLFERATVEKYQTAVGIYIAWRNGSLRGMSAAGYLTVEANSATLIEAIVAVL